ncbi:MAG TPA: hypothetical protein PLZ82_05025 [Smithellaceae bacterium]|nr:MAG: hypothetical protein BWX51_01957 [Bacteroidetes bacterium ADurb.Bin012]HOU56261.1 hypothetical protein [Smithellaceae bacterium]HQH04745.1 hypothetical protein [Smithellaceae bacterium]HQJ77531.1 hypothetical protein [Smithellaceae bacterium]
MKKYSVLLIIALQIISTATVFGSVGGKITQEIIERTIQKAAKTSGREIVELGAQKQARETLERLVKTHGDEVLKVVDDAGLELLQSVPKYGDEVVEMAMKVSPKARRALARNIPEMLPLARRVGVEALELEAKTPGLSTRVFNVFGDDAAKIIAKDVPTEDIPKLLKYGEMADSEKTRKLLLETYKKGGKRFLDNIPPNLVMASGLTAAIIYTAIRVTDPIPREPMTPEHFVDFLKSTIPWAMLLLLVVIILLLWRFGLMPWHRKKYQKAKPVFRKTEHLQTDRIKEKKEDVPNKSNGQEPKENKLKNESDDQMII